MLRLEGEGCAIAWYRKRGCYSLSFFFFSFSFFAHCSLLLKMIENGRDPEGGR